MNVSDSPEEAVVLDKFSDSAPFAHPGSIPQNAADTLENSEESYRFLFESNPHPTWVYDRETLRFLLVNESAIEHYGYSQKEFLAMTLLDIRPAEDAKLLSETISKALRSHAQQKGKCGVWQHRKKDGEIIDVEVTVNDLHFRGRPARMALLNDITENRRIERTRQQSEQEQRQFAEHLELERERLAQAIAKVGSWEFDFVTNNATYSDETYRICGLDRLAPGASREAFLERVHPDDHAAVTAAYTAAVASHSLYAMDHRILLADGGIKFVHTRCRTIYDPGGKPIHSVGTVQDITEQKETEQKLTRSLNLWRAITEGTSDAIYAKDLQGRYLMINVAGANFVGKTSEEILGQDDTALFLSEDAARTMATDRRVMQSGETLALESSAITAGVRRTYHSTKGPLRDSAGAIVGIVGISRDMTEHKQAKTVLHHIMEGAHCLLWQAEVTDLGEEKLQWKMQFASEQAAQRFLPLDVPAEQTYGDAWYFSRPVEDQERTDLFSETEIRAGRSYQQEVRCYSKDGILHWLSENVRVETLGVGRWRCIGVCTDITERKEQERDLVESEARTRLIIQTSLDAVVEIDSAVRIIGWNLQAEKTFGWSREEAIGQYLTDTIIPAQYTAMHLGGMAHFAKTGEGPLINSRIEVTARRHDGKEFPVEIAITAIDTAHGVTFSAFIQDISVRKQSEEMLRKSESLHRATVCGIADGVMVLDEHGKVLSINPAFAALHGLESSANGYGALSDYSQNFVFTALDGQPIPPQGMVCCPRA